METIQLTRPRELKATKPVRIILVGGFLGAGKTTALGALAKELESRGLKVGFVTNDQAVGLVDTILDKQTGAPVGEVAGGCFCCKFDDLVNVTQDLLDKEPDVLLCEPVGSCTDMAATVLNPLRLFYKSIFTFSPFTVLVDPKRVKQALSGSSMFPAEVFYIFWKQLEEADVIAINKCDTLPETEIRELANELGKRCNKPVVVLSATEGTNVASWTDSLLGDGEFGKNILKEIDYDTYATGEAVLGWLNATCEVKGAGYDGVALISSLMKKLNSQCGMMGSEIAHIKAILQEGTHLVRSNITVNDMKPFIDDNGAGKFGDAKLTLNARVKAKPGDLGGVAVRSFEAIAKEHGVEIILCTIESFAPGYPRPPYRMAELSQ